MRKLKSDISQLTEKNIDLTKKNKDLTEKNEQLSQDLDGLDWKNTELMTAVADQNNQLADQNNQLAEHQRNKIAFASTMTTFAIQSKKIFDQLTKAHNEGKALTDVIRADMAAAMEGISI